MTRTPTTAAGETLHVQKEVFIHAPQDVTWESLLEETGSAMTVADNVPMPMKLEPRPGGRWYRDLGNDAGHLWGHVQVIKPPALLELWGPMMMSYPAVNHIQYRLTPEGGGTRLTLTHRAVGLLDAKHAAGVGGGWAEILQNVRKNAERRISR